MSMPLTISEIGMLDLQPRVHLDEEEPAVLVEKLERSGAGVAELAHGVGGDAAEPARSRALSAGDGVSSRIFWCLRWSEQSRSPK